MMAGPKDENCPNSVGVDLTEAVCCSWTRIAVASMGADDSPGGGGDLGGGGQPVGQLPVQLRGVPRVPGVSMAGSASGHQGCWYL